MPILFSLYLNICPIQPIDPPKAIPFDYGLCYYECEPTCGE